MAALCSKLAKEQAKQQKYKETKQQITKSQITKSLSNKITKEHSSSVIKE